MSEFKSWLRDRLVVQEHKWYINSGQEILVTIPYKLFNELEYELKEWRVQYTLDVMHHRHMSFLGHRLAPVDNLEPTHITMYLINKLTVPDSSQHIVMAMKMADAREDYYYNTGSAHRQLDQLEDDNQTEPVS